MTKSIFTVVVLFLLSMTLNSCGVMFGGSKYRGTIVAKDHPNAAIYVNGEKAGNGEVSGLYKRNETMKVELKEEGCEPKTQNFSNAFRTGNFILSVVSWGLVGLGVDLGTGAAYKPDHRNDPDIERLSDKNFTFTMDYSECKKPSNTVETVDTNQ